MGLMDRDYMHDRHRASKNSRKAGRHAPEGITWKTVVWTAAISLALFLIVKLGLTLSTGKPFPPSGQILWYEDVQSQQSAPLTLVAPLRGDAYHVVRMDDPQSGRTLALIPVHRGDTVKLDVPLGKYNLLIASGDRWHGPEKLFGWGSEKKKAVQTFHFYRSGNQYFGHRIDLANRLDGNMKTRQVYPWER